MRTPYKILVNQFTKDQVADLCREYFHYQYGNGWSYGEAILAFQSELLEEGYPPLEDCYLVSQAINEYTLRVTLNAMDRNCLGTSKK